MKIGILTFHSAINYGAVLQAYGLQEYLKKLGHEVYIIDYRPSYLTYPYRIFRWDQCPVKFWDIFKWGIREIGVIPIRWKRQLGFRQFRNKYLNLYNLDLNNTDNQFDVFVFGSDQIWNKNITKGFDNVFWGDFPAAQNTLLVAYAASVGNISNIQSDSIEFIKLKLSSFLGIGVREKSLKDFLKTCSIPSEYVIDPVLLAGASVFEKLLRDRRPKKPYLLLFTLGRDEYVIPVAKKVAADLGLTIIEVVSSRETFNKKIKQSLAPSEFVTLVYNASYVVTSSYHGTVFSLLFQKDFSAVQLDSRNNDRITSLLESIDLEDRIISQSDEDITYTSINYAQIIPKLVTMRTISEDFVYSLIK